MHDETVVHCVAMTHIYDALFSIPCVGELKAEPISDDVSVLDELWAGDV